MFCMQFPAAITPPQPTRGRASTLGSRHPRRRSPRPAVLFTGPTCNPKVGNGGPYCHAAKRPGRCRVCKYGCSVIVVEDSRRGVRSVSPCASLSRTPKTTPRAFTPPGSSGSFTSMAPTHQTPCVASSIILFSRLRWQLSLKGLALSPEDVKKKGPLPHTPVSTARGVRRGAAQSRTRIACQRRSEAPCFQHMMLPLGNHHTGLANVSQTVVSGRSCLSATSKLLPTCFALDRFIGSLDQILDP